MARFRTEHDSLGAVRVPADAYWGPETQRALEVYRVSGQPVHPSLVHAYALLKESCAEANQSLGAIPPRIGRAISRAAREVAAGKLAGQFRVDAFHSGAGTSFHMNVNEVLANRALEILGEKPGSYDVVNPHDHVNLGQSTNDTFPTVLRVAFLWHARDLVRELQLTARELRTLSRKHSKAVKAGRTHLQDAMPVTFGQEFGAWAAALEKTAGRLAYKSRDLQRVPLGATAVGTGAGAPKGFRALAVRKLAGHARLPLQASENPFEALESAQDFLGLSGALRITAIELARVCNDLRLLSSGPYAGFGELRLPAVQPGSSIMPGKVNPSVPEMVDMACFQVLGNDHAVALAAEHGQLELNVFLPVVARNLLESLTLLANASRILRERVLKGLKTQARHARELAGRSTALATVLAQKIGYDEAAKLAKAALERGQTLHELVRETGLLSEAEFRKLFNLEKLAKGG
jgi:aspartate ammonia-lyase